MSHYIGRFAPSPTGLLHMGSLVAALGSFLDARAHYGQWFLRMENLDPPREMESASDVIPRQLMDHGLYWDGEITFQSKRLDLYEQYLGQLDSKAMLFACDCSRQRIKALGGLYDKRCRSRKLDFSGDVAIRMKLDTTILWKDLIQGQQKYSPDMLNGDFIIKRRDGLFSYQLAVAIDDALQGISHVIRGADLLDSTARQRYLHQHLGLNSPEYGHLPIVENTQGQKLSKQTHAKPLNSANVIDNLLTALKILGQNPAQRLYKTTKEEILDWAIANWSFGSIPRGASKLESE